MKTEVAILHNEYPSTVREHVADRIQSLAKFYEGTVSLRAVLERDADDHRVELVANVRRGVVLVVEAKANSITSALDDAVERMKRVLSRHKGKLKDSQRRQVRVRD